MHPTLFIVETVQDGIWIILQRIVLSILALLVLRSPPFEDVFYVIKPVNVTSER